MIPSATIASQVTAALTGLGSTPGEVAQTLASKGIRGVKSEPSSCVVAQYLAEQFPGYLPSVGPRFVFLFDETAYGRITVDTPWTIAQAITNFDCGDYPDLIAP